jgi:hypothetical protein
MESRSLPPAEPGIPHQATVDRGVYTVGPPQPTEVDTAALDDPKVLQMLSTEHWSLLATRSLSWNESFSRTGIFLSVLSASVVALGLVGGATGIRGEFVIFALVLLPVTLFVGIATFVRLDEVNVEDVMWVAGMNRIRNAYVQIRPAIEPFLISGWTDDEVGIARTFGMTREPTRANTFVHQFVTTPGMVAVTDGVLAGAIAGIAASQLLPNAMAAIIPLAVIVGAAMMGVLFYSSVRRGRRVIGSWRPRFPLPPDHQTDPLRGDDVAPPSRN